MRFIRRSVLCLPKKRANLASTPFGNVQLGKKIATTKQRSYQATLTTAGARYNEQRCTTLHLIPPKSYQDRRGKEWGKGRDQPQPDDKGESISGIHEKETNSRGPVFKYSTNSTGNLSRMTMVSEQRSSNKKWTLWVLETHWLLRLPAHPTRYNRNFGILK